MNSTTTAMPRAAPPPELTRGLRKMIRRVRRIILLRGIMVTLGVLLAVVLAIMAIDAAVVISADSVRWGLSLAGFIFVATAAWNALLRPLCHSLTPFRMARVLETRHPELQERISSALELMSLGGDAAAMGSRQLIEMLAADAKSDVAAVSPRQEFSGQTLRPALWSAGAAACVLLLLFVCWPRQTTLLLARAVAPHVSMSNLHGAAMRLEPGDVVRLQGDPLVIRLTVPEWTGQRAELHVEADGRPPTVERMRRVTAAAGAGADATGVLFEVAFPCLRNSFRYRARFGPGITRYHRVEVLPPPACTNLAMVYDYPSYTGLPPFRQVTDGVRDICAVAGTWLRLTARLNRPLEARLLLDDRPVPPDATGPGNIVTWEWRLATNTADRWTIALRDRHGFTNRLDWAACEVEPDRPPLVRLVLPAGSKYVVPAHSLVRLRYTIDDDFGLASARLAIRAEGAAGERLLDVETKELGENSWSVDHDIFLPGLRLGGARRLRIWLQAADTLPLTLGGPNTARSRVLELTLDDQQTRGLADQMREEQRQALENLFEDAARKLEEAADNVASATNMLDEAQLKPEAAARIEEAQRQAEEAAEMVARADQQARESLFAGLAPELRRQAQEEIAAAEEKLAAIPPSEPENRPPLAEQAIADLRQAAATTRDLLPRLQEADQMLAEAARMEDLARRQEAQAEEARERRLAAEEIDAWQKRQAAIAEETRQADETAARQALEAMAAAQQLMAEERARSPAEAAELQAARQAEDAARRSLDAARQALDAAQAAENLADEAALAARQPQDAADFADAARQAAEAIARMAQAAAEHAGQAEAMAQEAAATALRQTAERDDAMSPAEQALQAAMNAKATAEHARTAAREAADAAAQPPEAASEETAARIAAMADETAQAARKTQDLATQARLAAEQQQAAQAASSARKSREAADLGGRAAEASRQAAQLTAAGEMQPAAAKAEEARLLAEESARQAQEALLEAVLAAAEAGQQQPAGQLLESAARAQVAAEMTKQAADRATQAANTAQPEEPRNLPSSKQQAEEAAGLAQQAVRQAEQALALAQTAQTPGEAQQEAARHADTAAQEMGRLAEEKARRAGLDPAAMQMAMMPGEKESTSAGIRRYRMPAPQAGGTEAMPLFLRDMGFPEAEWTRFRGSLDTGMLEGALRQVPPEYRDLVRNYFLMLAREGMRPQPPAGEEQP